MPSIASMRLLNNVTSGATSAAALQTLLDNPTTLGFWQGLLANRTCVDQLLSSDVGWDATLNSDTALRALCDSQRGSQRLAVHETRLPALLGNRPRALVATASPMSTSRLFDKYQYGSHNLSARITPQPLGSINCSAFGAGIYVMAGTGSGSFMQTSPDGITWTQQPMPLGGNTALAIIFANDQFVMAGNGSQVATSPDGITWTNRGVISGTNAINGLFFAAGLYVAVGAAGTLATSPDGVAWTSRSANQGTTVLNAVTFGAGLFVVVGAAGVVSTSPDGVIWTARAALGASVARAIIFNGNLFITAGDAATVSTSTDGINFITHTSGMPGAINSVSFGAGLNVVVGTSGGVATSPDGIDWTLRSLGHTNTVTTIDFNGGIFLLGDTAGHISKSVDGLGYSSSMAVGGVANGAIQAMANNATTIMVATSAGLVSTSQDSGLTWQARTAIRPLVNITALAFGAGLFVSINSAGRVHTSPDGDLWTSGEIVLAGQAPAFCTFVNGLFIVGTQSATTNMATSPDGITWTARSSANILRTFEGSIAFGRGRYVLVGEAGNISSSLDGMTWVNQGGRTVQTNRSIAFGNGVFVLSTTSGIIWTSANGLTWTNSASVGFWMFQIIFINGVFIGSTNLGTFATSTDGITWTQRANGLGTSVTAPAMVSHNGVLVAAATNGNIVTSV